MNMRWRVIAWLALLTYWLVLVSLTHLPPRLIPITGVSDKLLHIMAYSGLTLFVYAALWVTFPRRRIALVVILLVLVHGGLDEWTQGMVGRGVELLDWVADLVGAVLGVGIMLLVRHLSPQDQPHELPPIAPVGKMYDVPAWSRHGRPVDRH